MTFDTLFLNVRQAAEKLGTSRSTVNALIDDELIKTVRVGSRILISAAEFDAFVQKYKSSASAAHI
jgi:excisionase family DNA binding protein